VPVYKVASSGPTPSAAPKVLAHIGRGLTDAEIASALCVSPRTAQTHRSNILIRLGIESTPKLMRFAIENGFCSPSCKDGKSRTAGALSQSKARF